MSTPKNLQRDGTWITPDTSENIALSTPVALSSSQVFANAKTPLHVDIADVQVRVQDSIAVDNIAVAGVYMQPPQGDNQPYRVKADGIINGLSGTVMQPCVVIGYGPAAPTGSDDIIDQPYVIPFNQGEYDDVLFLPQLLDTDPNFGRPLFIGIGFMASNTITNLYVIAHLSVQNLGVRPPTMHYAVA